MTKIKICGITSEDDITILNRYMPDYMGFVFAESRRRVTAQRAAGLAAKLDAAIKKAGVFVNASVDEAVETTAIVGLDVIQLHGDETEEFILELRQRLDTIGKYPAANIEIWKGIRVKDKKTFEQLGTAWADRYLLDSWTEGSYGGSGRTFDWSLIEKASKDASVTNEKLVVAGGLNSENAAEAIKRMHPFAVDVSSGVETDGRKNEKKIRDFIKIVRNIG